MRSRGSEPANLLSGQYLYTVPLFVMRSFCSTLFSLPYPVCLYFRLAGPYDILLNKTCDDDADYLLHSRYFYDIPEFMTVLTGLFHYYLSYEQLLFFYGDTWPPYLGDLVNVVMGARNHGQGLTQYLLSQLSIPDRIGLILDILVLDR